MFVVYPRQWRTYLAIRVITGRYLAHRTASIVSERATEPRATTVIDHCLLLLRGLILYILLFLLRPIQAQTNKEVYLRPMEFDCSFIHSSFDVVRGGLIAHNCPYCALIADLHFMRYLRVLQH